MTQGRKRSKFFDDIQASIEDVLKNCHELKVSPQDSGRVVNVNHPQARQRAGCFRGSLAMQELEAEYGKIFKVSIVSDNKFEVGFKEEIHDELATIRGG